MNNSHKKPVITPIAAVLLFASVVLIAVGVIAAFFWDSYGSLNFFNLFLASYEIEEAVAILVIGLLLLVAAIAIIYSKTKMSD
ncbi:MAG: hypothetical protein LUG49_05300 [Oscillospiraceae bacterium]|nr:hypothetical protein [Oscillospiraceae bacterium]